MTTLRLGLVQWMLVGALSLGAAACGDDGDASGADAGADAMAGGADAPAGPTSSTEFDNPTDLAIGQTGSGSLPGGPTGPTHFWRFTPATGGDYVVTLTGSVHASTTWCGNGASAGGCLCDVTPVMDPCCDIASTSCMAYTGTLTAADDGILIVYNQGPDPVTYTVSIAAQ